MVTLSQHTRCLPRNRGACPCWWHVSYRERSKPQWLHYCGTLCTYTKFTAEAKEYDRPQLAHRLWLYSDRERHHVPATHISCVSLYRWADACCPTSPGTAIYANKGNIGNRYPLVRILTLSSHDFSELALTSSYSTVAYFSKRNLSYLRCLIWQLLRICCYTII